MVADILSLSRDCVHAVQVLLFCAFRASDEVRNKEEIGICCKKEPNGRGVTIPMRWEAYRSLASTCPSLWGRSDVSIRQFNAPANHTDIREAGHQRIKIICVSYRMMRFVTVQGAPL